MGVGADLLAARAADLVVPAAMTCSAASSCGLRRAALAHARARAALDRPAQRAPAGCEGAALVLMARDADAPRVRLGRCWVTPASSDGSHVAAPDPRAEGSSMRVRGARWPPAGRRRGRGLRERARHGHAISNDRIETAVLRPRLGARAGAVPSIRSRARWATRWAPPRRWRRSCACSPRATAWCRHWRATRSRIRVRARRARRRARRAAGAVSPQHRRSASAGCQRRARAGGRAVDARPRASPPHRLGAGVAALPRTRATRRASGVWCRWPPPPWAGERFRHATRSASAARRGRGGGRLRESAFRRRRRCGGRPHGARVRDGGRVRASNRGFIGGGGALYFPV